MTGYDLEPIDPSPPLEMYSQECEGELSATAVGAKQYRSGHFCGGPETKTRGRAATGAMRSAPRSGSVGSQRPPPVHELLCDPRHRPRQLARQDYRTRPRNRRQRAGDLPHVPDGVPSRRLAQGPEGQRIGTLPSERMGVRHDRVGTEREPVTGEDGRKHERTVQNDSTGRSSPCLAYNTEAR
jgi:hypothetical protein